MKAECEKFGEVRKVIVFDVSIDSFSFTFLFTFKRDYCKLRPPIGLKNRKMKETSNECNLSLYHLIFSPLRWLQNIICLLSLKQGGGRVCVCLCVCGWVGGGGVACSLDSLKISLFPLKCFVKVPFNSTDIPCSLEIFFCVPFFPQTPGKPSFYASERTVTLTI